MAEEQEKRETEGQDVPVKVQEQAEPQAELAKKWREIRRELRAKVDEAKDTMADHLLATAEQIRKQAMETGDDEVIRQASQMARSLEKAAVYLDSRTLEQIGEDATQVVRQNPWESILAAFGIGVFIGLLLRRR